MNSIWKFDHDINDKKTENLCISESYQTMRKNGENGE